VYSSSFVNEIIPHSVCPTTYAVSVPSRRFEITSERSASSLATPPAFRITCASPSSRPSARDGSTRASMHVSTASRRAGFRASEALPPHVAA
jgi:hypothetical protein